MGLRSNASKCGFSLYLPLLVLVLLAVTRVSAQESVAETDKGKSNGSIKDLGRRSKSVDDYCQRDWR
ncbi:hypothetical protein F0562_031146 [Nyssa sinensis]|uniref:Uncharacterized protein n=1 Tax=Nyssa sinensis TaxID=561372 RepID=A0A5J5AS64_9ASTE|nr:hypothetical protein F0562_031146 [Nyssa sinensis]